jgi:arsenite methyltransferase
MKSDTAFWNATAEKYSRRPVGNPAAFDRKIAITKAHMQPRDVVLDIGCGTGSLALRLAADAHQVHGLDLSSEMIRIARGKAEATGVDNVSFHVGAFDDGFDAFAPGSLDGICAYSLLHLLEDRPAALARIHRLLKPGGFFVSSTVCLGESRIPYSPLLRVMRWLGKAPTAKVIDKRTLVEEIRAAGFSDVAEPDVGAEPIVAFLVAARPA